MLHPIRGLYGTKTLAFLSGIRHLLLHQQSVVNNFLTFPSHGVDSLHQSFVAIALQRKWIALLFAYAICETAPEYNSTQPSSCEYTLNGLGGF